MRLNSYFGLKYSIRFNVETLRWSKKILDEHSEYIFCYEKHRSPTASNNRFFRIIVLIVFQVRRDVEITKTNTKTTSEFGFTDIS